MGKGHGVHVVLMTGGDTRDAARATIDAQIEAAHAAGARIGSATAVRAAHMRGTAFSVRYVVNEPDVEMLIEGHGPDELAEALRRHAATLARARAEATAPRVMTRVDAAVARATCGGDAVRKLARKPQKSTFVQVPGAAALRDMTIPAAAYASYTSTAGDAVSLKIEGARITIQRAGFGARSGEGQIVQNGCLLVGTKDAMPDIALLAMRGRRLDEVVSGSVLAGNDLVIAKAWVSGGKLGFSFDKGDVAVDEAFPSQRARMAA